MEHIWTIENWVKILNENGEKSRKGLRLRFDKGIDPEVHRACAEFAAFLRREYFFPIRVPIYFKNTKKIKCIETEEIFLSIGQAKKKYSGDIQACCAGRQKTAGGLHWIYLEE